MCLFSSAGSTFGSERSMSVPVWSDEEVVFAVAEISKIESTSRSFSLSCPDSFSIALPRSSNGNPCLSRKKDVRTGEW